VLLFVLVAQHATRDNVSNMVVHSGLRAVMSPQKLLKSHVLPLLFFFCQRGNSKSFVSYGMACHCFGSCHRPSWSTTHRELIPVEGVADGDGPASLKVQHSHSPGCQQVRDARVGPVIVRQTDGLSQVHKQGAQLAVLKFGGCLLRCINESELKLTQVRAVPGTKAWNLVATEATAEGGGRRAAAGRRAATG